MSWWRPGDDRTLGPVVPGVSGGRSERSGAGDDIAAAFEQLHQRQSLWILLWHVRPSTLEVRLVGEAAQCVD